MRDHDQLDGEIAAHYASVAERERLAGPGSLERIRTWELLNRYLPPPPAVVLDVGGGAGVYALLLAARGYEVHLIDPAAPHVEQARRASDEQPATPLASATVGDARRLDRADASVDAALLLGPLYHLTERGDRVAALAEARRVLRPGAVLAVAAISRFASTYDGLLRGHLDELGFEAIVERDVREGQHRNPTRRPQWFTTAYFHLPDELAEEVGDAGLLLHAVLAVEGPAGCCPTSPSGWRTRHAGSASSTRSGGSKPSRACSARAPTCSPSRTADPGGRRPSPTRHLIPRRMTRRPPGRRKASSFRHGQPVALAAWTMTLVTATGLEIIDRCGALTSFPTSSPRRPSATTSTPGLVRPRLSSCSRRRRRPPPSPRPTSYLHRAPRAKAPAASAPPAQA